MSRNAFLDPVTQVLKCHGFVESNEAGDIKMMVSTDFMLKPGEWRWDGAQWVSFIPPKPFVQFTGNDVLDFLVKEKVLTQKAVDDAKAAKG